MALNENQQILQAIDRAQQIIVVFQRHFNTDTVCAATTLYRWLKQRSKIVDLASADFLVPANLSFLEELPEIKNELDHLRKLIIKLNMAQKKVASFTYDLAPSELKIFITPADTEFSGADVSAAPSSYLYDLIITVGAADLATLGHLFTRAPDFFFQTPIINFDFSAANERFGAINLVDLTASSLSEIIFKFLRAADPAHFDEHLASYLFAGLIAQTAGFKSGKITPEILHLTSELLAFGVDQEKITRHLFASRPLASLKLWGKIFAQLQHDTALNLVWATLSYDDLSKSGAALTDLTSAVEELKLNLARTHIIVIIYERPAQPGENGPLTACAEIFVSPNFHALDLVRALNSTGDRHHALVILDAINPLAAEEIVIREIKKKLTAQLSV